jgi:toxin ParE1/3/4
MARLFVRERAWAAVEELSTFIARDNPAAAAEVVRQLRLSFEQLARTPQLGRAVRNIETTERLRMWLSPAFRNYLIFYRKLQDGVEIVRVLHGARNIQRILEDS